MLKKLIILSLIPMVISLAGCDSSNNRHYTSHGYSFTAKYGETATKVDGGSFEYEPIMFKELNEHQFNVNLAKIAGLAAADIAGAEVKIIESDGKVIGDGLPTSMMTYLGFKDIEYYENKDDHYEIDPHDYASFYVGHLELGSVQVFMLNILGTIIPGEWASNFDIGIDSPQYMVKPDSHPEWKHKENHKGYDVAANRILNNLMAYRMNALEPSKETVFFLTGHSRGGAICDIITPLLNANNYKVFTYTFSAPNSTFVSGDTMVDNIFNITNKDDVVPKLPPESLGVRTYGKRINYSISENLDYWKEKLPDIPYLGNPKDSDTIGQVVKDICVDRETTFEIPKVEDDVCVQTFHNKEEAEAAYEHYANLFGEGDIKRLHVNVKPLVEVSRVRWDLYIDSAPAFILDLLIGIMTGEISILSALSDGYIDFIRRYLPLTLPAIGVLMECENISALFEYPHHVETSLLALEFQYKN